MVNIPSSINFSEISLLEQREFLQGNNPDKLAGVFNLTSSEWDMWYELSNLENVLCCYPNQLQDGQILLPDDFWEGKIVILNMWALRKGEIQVIAWNESRLPIDIESPILLSPWVIEYWKWKEWKKYTQTVLRDGWKVNSWDGITSLADANERTTTAGRNFSWKLNEDLDIENAEESPFLMQNDKWEYFLVMPDLKNKHHLVASIKNYLENKYVSPDNENYDEVKSKFELKFRWLKYEELWQVLESVIKNDHFEEYKWTEWHIEWVEKDHIKLWEEEWDFYVFHDKENNTIEYREIREITWFPQWLKAVWRLPLRLFLESQNQDPSFKKIQNIWNYGSSETGLVPTIDDFSRKVRSTMD